MLLNTLLRKLRTAVQLTLTGRWHEWWWLRKCRPWEQDMNRRGIDLDPVSLEKLGLEKSRSNEHGSTPGPELAKVLRVLKVGPEDRILDFGCGKGSALITMAAFPFSRIAGCDISPDLISIARSNLLKLNIDRVILHCCDATALLDLDDYTHYYFFNPFPSIVFQQVMDNVRDSVRRMPRRVTIIYRNPMCHSAVVAGSVFHKAREFRLMDKSYFIYLSHEPTAPRDRKVCHSSRS